MKKIPTLFKRIYERHRIVGITDEITPGCKEAFLYGIPTIKFDGSCCAIIDGEFYKRYDAKKGKRPPEGAIPCCDPNPVTGHHPHWVKVNPDEPSDKWFVKALENYNHTWDPLVRDNIPPRFPSPARDGTYEACGLHFNGNPYNLEYDILVPHGADKIVGLTETIFPLTRTFESVKAFLQDSKLEGIVFWHDGEPVCKIKRTDFGFDWPIKTKN